MLVIITKSVSTAYYIIFNILKSKTFLKVLFALNSYNKDLELVRILDRKKYCLVHMLCKSL